MPMGTMARPSNFLAWAFVCPMLENETGPHPHGERYTMQEVLVDVLCTADGRDRKTQTNRMTPP